MYVVSFIDRQILAVPIGPIRHEFGASDISMGLLPGFVFPIFYILAGVPIARYGESGMANMAPLSLEWVMRYRGLMVRKLIWPAIRKSEAICGPTGAPAT